ncbi:M20/M25/M40 family metallo-hydrolase [Streptomyces marincola]|uniref:M20/M25/M40 family metallo-hydrolase n=1 Tax=Streptomyces marincola TaxID=2878388 RepID=UPI0020FFFBC9|nr:M20/M25/M40 family metallo-hydrolase [Streptomyces marincola]
MTFRTGTAAPLVPLALLALLVTAVLTPAALAAPERTPEPETAHDRPGALARALVERTGAAGAWRHLEAFQRIADANDGNRAAGTPGHERSARYAGTLLARAGYRVTYQRFTFPYREPVTERLTRLDGEPRDVPVRAFSHTGNTQDGGLTARLADAGDGCEAARFGPDAPGLIALVERGGCTFAAKEANARAAGAAAVLIRNNAPGTLSGTLGGPDPDTLPTGGITREDGAELASALASGHEVRLRLELTELSEERTTVNVIAETPGGDDSRVVLAGAHLDSVPEGPGINDNGSGSAAVLETALRLAEAGGPAGRHPHTVRFALWSAEELGLLGAKHYVKGLSPDERGDIALYLNFDMVGSPNHGHYVQADAPGVAEELTAFLRARGEEAERLPFDGRSDYAPFVAVGIPAAGTFTGAEAVKSPAQARLWGGTPGAPHDPCYHAACDRLDNMGRAAFDTHVKVVAHAVGTYAWRAPSAASAPDAPAGS